MPFCSDLDVMFVDGHNWKLVEPLCYDDLKEGRTFRIPTGFMTDFASIPRGLWNVLPPTGKWGPAAVVHDYLYRLGLVPRDVADRVLLHGMEDLGVSWITRSVIYRGVRMFGRPAYKG